MSRINAGGLADARRGSPRLGGARVPDAGADASTTHATLVRGRAEPAPTAAPTAPASGSIVIPAHDEEAVIGRGLHRVLASLPDGVEVIVVCNGCVDGTADVARAAGPRVQVIELSVASKVEALRKADGVATAFPRAYVDADVLVSGRSLEAVFRRLEDGEALAARPPLVYDSSTSSWVVRRFYRARCELPAVLGSLWGAGMYVLSASGRARFGEFPDVVADDLFIDTLFQPNEVELVDTDPVVVVAPTSLSGLLASLRRVYRGNRALAGHAVAMAGPRSADTVRDLLRLARRGPAELGDAIVYASVVTLARALAWRHRASNSHWERDGTSRR